MTRTRRLGLGKTARPHWQQKLEQELELEAKQGFNRPSFSAQALPCGEGRGDHPCAPGPSPSLARLGMQDAASTRAAVL